MTSESAPTTYDDIPYDCDAFRPGHVDNMATVAQLLGAEVAAPEGCRVLELGCGVGGNLIPMALSMPESTLVGIDLSSKQIELARQAAQATGAANVTFEPLNIMQVPAGFGHFDFIIAHGVYSWVPPEVREALMTVCSRHLSEHGVACISYNTLPGWKVRSVVRDAMLFHTQGMTEPRQRIEQARAMLQMLGQAAPSVAAEYAAVFDMERRLLAQAAHAETYLFHELLEEHNHPVYFQQFAAHAARHGLQFLAEAELSESRPSSLPPVMQQLMKQLEGDIVRREQYLDFAVNRLFRISLLVHQAQQIDSELRLERIRGLRIAAPLKREEAARETYDESPVEFTGLQDRKATTADPLCKAAFALLGETWPRSIPFDELVREARAKLVNDDQVMYSPADQLDDDAISLAASLLRLYENGIVQLHALPDAFVTEVSDRPTASAWARHQVQQGDRVTNQRHDMVTLDPIQHALLPHLDGSHSRAQLVDHLAQLVEQQGLVIQRDDQPINNAGDQRLALNDAVECALSGLAESALLAG